MDEVERPDKEPAERPRQSATIPLEPDESAKLGLAIRAHGIDVVAKRAGVGAQAVRRGAAGEAIVQAARKLIRDMLAAGAT